MRLPAFFSKLIISYFRFIVAAVVIVLLTGGYVLFIRAKVTTLRTSGYLERANVERDLKSEKEYLQQLKSAAEKFHRLLPKEKLTAINKFVPTGADFPGLVLTVRNIAAAANLDLSTIAVSETTTIATTAAADGTTNEGGSAAAQAATISGVSLRTQDVTITVKGGQNYETFKRFVALLESSQRLLDVISVSFSHAAEGSDVGASYTVVLRTYYLPTSSSS